MDFINKDLQRLFDILHELKICDDQKVIIMELAMKMITKSYDHGIAAASEVAERHLKFNSLTV